MCRGSPICDQRRLKIAEQFQKNALQQKLAWRIPRLRNISSKHSDHQEEWKLGSIRSSLFHCCPGTEFRGPIKDQRRSSLEQSAVVWDENQHLQFLDHASQSEKHVKSSPACEGLSPVREEWSWRSTSGLVQHLQKSRIYRPLVDHLCSYLQLW